MRVLHIIFIVIAIGTIVVTVVDWWTETPANNSIWLAAVLFYLRFLFDELRLLGGK